jgi:hypothetical protein
MALAVTAAMAALLLQLEMVALLPLVVLASTDPISPSLTRARSAVVMEVTAVEQASAGQAAMVDREVMEVQALVTVVVAAQVVLAILVAMAVLVVQQSLAPEAMVARVELALAVVWVVMVAE